MSTATKTKVLEACFELYLETGEWHTAAEIAKRAGVSAQTARAALNADDGVGVHEEARASMSKSYRHMQIGSHKVTTYGPTSGKLREMVLSLRKAQP